MMHHATIYIDIANSTFEQYYARSWTTKLSDRDLILICGASCYTGFQYQ